MKVRDVTFQSGDAELRGFLSLPPGVGPHPVVILAHGTSATVPMVLKDYATAFVEAGLGTLAYDHRGFGRSSGEPRQQINPWIQGRGYSDALRFLRSQTDVDSERLALWGDSYSGMVALVVAACEPALRALVVQCPVCGSSSFRGRADKDAFVQMRAILETGDVSGTAETTTGPLPVVSPDPISQPSLLTPIQAFRWFIDFGGRPGSGWVNRVTRVVPPTSVPFAPAIAAPYIHASTLMMVAPEDEMTHCNPQVARMVFEAIEADKEFVEVGGGHFGLLYPGSADFERAVKIQSSFLRRVLI